MFEYQAMDFIDNGKCSNCGNCCSNILPLSDDEVTKIRQHIKKHKIREQKHNYMNCPFRDEVNKKCLIYEIRPEICRQFMCNHTKADVTAAKIGLNKKIVFMRSEFYGNRQDIESFMNFIKEISGEINEKR